MYINNLKTNPRPGVELWGRVVASMHERDSIPGKTKSKN